MKKIILSFILVMNIFCYSQNSAKEDWVMHFPPVFNYENFYIVDMEMDDQGNMYFSGYVGDNTPGNADIITIKMMNNGSVEWISIYNGPTNGDDVVQDLEIDNEGNCYVAGITSTGNNNNDYITIKYNTSGHQIWVNTYNGATNYVDRINDLFIDNFGYIYVTGASYEESQSHSNATTIKYNPNGVMQWKNTYIDSNNYSDGGNALIVDNTGNVYVACQTYTTSGQFLTIKYNAAGIEQWTKINGSAGQHEYAQFIGTDNSGKITVGGNTFDANINPIGYIIYKFNPDGSYAGGGTTYNSYSVMKGMSVSPQGNVYVTGSHFNMNVDYSTVKFNANGSFQWERRFNGGLGDFSSDLAIDPDENIYVTGSNSFSNQYKAVTIKYNSSGDSLWANSYDNPLYNGTAGNVIVLNNTGDLFIAIGNYSQDIGSYPQILKLNSNGVQQWVSDFKSKCQPTSVKEDTKGNIYLTGFGGLNESMWDYITMKCDSSGNILWIKTYDGPANGTEQASDLEIDQFGNVYVTGGSNGNGTDYDFATIKYDSSGNEQWVVRYNGPAFGSDIAGFISVDQGGNVYISGSSINSNSTFDIATIKYNNLGQLQWVKRYNGTVDGNDLSQGLEVDQAGNIFITGTSDSSGTLYDYVTVKYDPSGNTEWVRRYNGPANDGDVVSSMSLDNSGNVYLTGWSFGNTTNSDYATVKYNSSGDEKWAARWDDPASSYDYANDVAVDENGNVYVTGISQGMGTDNDYTTVKYNSLGEQQWSVPYDGNTNGSDISNNIAVDYLGDVYVTGHTDNNIQYSTIKYDKQGALQWKINYDFTNFQDSPTDLLIDNGGNVVVAGYSYQPAEEWLWSIVKYKQLGYIPSDIEQVENVPSEFALYQNYPNPFNPSTIIKWQSPISSWQALKVYDILGNEVATLVDEFKPSGKYEAIFYASNLASGIYLYKIQAGTFIEIKKMLLLR